MGEEQGSCLLLPALEAASPLKIYGNNAPA